jgi:hypothetical protein
MSKSHNKKRNVGIIYELLLRHISSSLVENDKVTAEKCLKIIENHFGKSTEIYKEFRLFNALANTTVTNSSVAAAILTEARGAARRTDISSLNREKSRLIRSINHILDDPKFYHRRVPHYRAFATIQTLLNDWRERDKSDLSRVVRYESQIIDLLLKEKDESGDLESNTDVDSLIVSLMTKKMNEKYSQKFSENQKNILKEYVFSQHNGNTKEFSENLCKIVENASKRISELKDKTDNETILSKIDSVKERIVEIDYKNVDDKSISKFLLILSLNEEIERAIENE